MSCHCKTHLQHRTQSGHNAFVTASAPGAIPGHVRDCRQHEHGPRCGSLMLHVATPTTSHMGIQVFFVHMPSSNPHKSDGSDTTLQDILARIAGHRVATVRLGDFNHALCEDNYMSHRHCAPRVLCKARRHGRPRQRERRPLPGHGKQARRRGHARALIASHDWWEQVEVIDFTSTDDGTTAGGQTTSVHARPTPSTIASHANHPSIHDDARMYPSNHARWPSGA